MTHEDRLQKDIKEWETIEIQPWTIVGERLKKVRQDAGWTIEEVATYLEITPQQLTMIEHGEKKLKLTLLLKLCTLYNIDDWDLLTQKEFNTTYTGAGKREKKNRRIKQDEEE